MLNASHFGDFKYSVLHFMKKITRKKKHHIRQTISKLKRTYRTKNGHNEYEVTMIWNKRRYTNGGGTKQQIKN